MDSNYFLDPKSTPKKVLAPVRLLRRNSSQLPQILSNISDSALKTYPGSQQRKHQQQLRLPKNLSIRDFDDVEVDLDTPNTTAKIDQELFQEHFTNITDGLDDEFSQLQNYYTPQARPKVPRPARK